MDTLTDRKLKAIVVAPGSIYSTYDTYIYYLDAFQASENIEDARGFAFHNVTEYHRLAREAMYMKYNVMYGTDIDDIVRGAKELLLEVVVHKPDIIFFIDGSKFPVALFRELRLLRRDVNRKFVIAGYITEAPYIDGVTDKYAKYFDVIFTNELNDVSRRDPNGEKAVYYLPHSYSEKVHYVADVHNKYKKDVFFCGTVYPERAKLLSEVNWTGIDAMIRGSFATSDNEDAVNQLMSYGVAAEGGIENSEVAEYYRGSKISINLGRTLGWTPNLDLKDIDPDSAYSVGPRVIEAAACGAFIISEYRPEIEKIFGDSVPTFRDANELERLIRYYLANEDERIEKAKRSTLAVKGMTYSDRARFVINILRQAIDMINFGGQNG